jgi:hypothetical protein
MTQINDVTRLLDISEQLSIALQNISSVPHGVVARIYAVGLGIIAVAFGALAWHFDYDATIQYALPVLESVVGSIPSAHAMYIPYIAWALSVMPTAIEMFLPRAAANNFFAGLSLYAMLIFDMATDAPRVSEMMGLYGVTAGLSYWVGFPILLLFASIGFELMFVVCAVSAIYLMLRG